MTVMVIMVNMSSMRPIIILNLVLLYLNLIRCLISVLYSVKNPSFYHVNNLVVMVIKPKCMP
jgi:hypothetical protein